MILRQITPQRFPSGDFRPVAVIALSPAELTSRFGFVFRDEADDLDHYQVAALEHDNIGQVIFFRHRHSPDRGTNVLVDSELDMDSSLSAVQELLSLTINDFSWIAQAEL